MRDAIGDGSRPEDVGAGTVFIQIEGRRLKEVGGEGGEWGRAVRTGGASVKGTDAGDGQASHLGLIFKRQAHRKFLDNVVFPRNFAPRAPHHAAFPHELIVQALR